jgi:hypothetical protein
MNTFLLDLWHDLKQKRLWPVAVVLIAATAAVPVVLTKPTQETGEAETPPLRSAQAQLPPIDAESVSASSNLEVFDPHDPFSVDKDRPKTPDTGTASSSSGKSPLDGLDAKISSSTSSGSDVSGAGGSPGGSGGAGGGGGGGTFWFTYEIDVKFGAVGAAKTKKGLQALDVLPSEENPVSVFMGIKDGGKTALFMILDPGMEVTGEGNCTPSPDRCGFVELKVKEDRDEVFLNSSRGDDYNLRLLRIRRVRVNEPPKEQEAEGARASRRNRPHADPFFLPLLLARAAGD